MLKIIDGYFRMSTVVFSPCASKITIDDIDQIEHSAWSKGGHMPATKMTTGVRWITRRQAATIVDSHSQRVLGISAKKFISNWKAGKYRKLDSDECPGVTELALLAPLPRRTSGSKNTKRRDR
jgi:hypothetical protein